MDLTNKAATAPLLHGSNICTNGRRRLLTASRFGIVMRDKKLLRIMKLSAILMLAACMQVAAKGLSQTVTLSVKNAGFEKVFLEIRRQTGCQFVYGTNMLQNAGTVTVEIKNAPLQTALDECFKGKPFTYVMVNKTIVVKPAPSAVPAAEPHPPIDISGRVTDDTGQPLTGVTIVVKGSNNSSQTNANGEFRLTKVEDNAVLVFSYVGYKQQEVAVGKRSTISLQMQLAPKDLEEVAVTIHTGYQSISRDRATGSFSTIRPERLEAKLKPDIRTMLEGLAAGVVLNKDGTIEIRGASTFSAEKAPLIVVDGYPISGGLETINADNIENITVLKDAVAASIYGSRSSNGVIVITTRAAKKGKLSVEYRGVAGKVLRPKLSYLNRANSADYVDAEMESYTQNAARYQNDYNNYGYVSRLKYLLVAKDKGLITAAEADAQIEQLKHNDGTGQLEKHLFQNQLIQQHNLTLAAGNDKSAFTASVRYITNQGNMTGGISTQGGMVSPMNNGPAIIGSGDNRLIIDLKNDLKLSNRLSFQVLTNINYTTAEAPVRTISELLDYSEFTNLLHPYDLVADPATGEWLDIYAVNPRTVSRYAAIPGLKPMDYNPLRDLTLEMTKTQNLQMRLGGTIRLNILQGLSAEAGGIFTRGSGLSRTVYDKNSFRMRSLYNNATSVSNPATHYIPDGAMLDESRNISQIYTLRGQLNFNRTFKSRHSVMAIAGGEMSRDVLDNNTYPTRFGYNPQVGTFASFNYIDYNAGKYNADMLNAAGFTPAGAGGLGFRDNRFVSVFANGSYEYDHRYIISGSIRLDQTNFWGTDPRFRYKPLWSVGGTHKISSEKFFNVPSINRLHLRGSYGLNGNISLNQGPFLVFTTAGITPAGDVAYGISSVPNKTLRWEKTATINIGSDISFLQSRFNVTLDYYLRKSKDLLAPDIIDATTGFSTITKNAGQINNTGIEVTVDANVIQQKNFKWNVLATASFNKNSVVEYNVNYLYPTQVTAISGAVNREGYASNALFSYRYAHLDDIGRTLYYNADGKEGLGGQMLLDDVVYSGTLTPKYVFALTNTFRYKQFELACLFIAKTGNVFRRDGFSSFNYQNKYAAQRWRKPGDEKHAIYPKLSSNSSDVFYMPYADIFVEDASFIKWRDLTLSYNLKDSWIKPAGLSAAKIYFQGRHLFMWAANSDKIDPEYTELNRSGGAIGREQTYPSLPARPEFYAGILLAL